MDGSRSRIALRTCIMPEMFRQTRSIACQEQRDGLEEQELCAMGVPLG
jgi:hypothetical protein